MRQLRAYVSTETYTRPVRQELDRAARQTAGFKLRRRKNADPGEEGRRFFVLPLSHSLPGSVSVPRYAALTRGCCC